MKRITSVAMIFAVSLIFSTTFTSHSHGKQASAFFPKQLVEIARDNAQRGGWAANTRDNLIREAEHWKELSDDELWDLMYGNTLRRSWMVWSNGHCPSCGQGVPMYNWKIDSFKHPWKVQCPHCVELFPKNDFQKYHSSGLDQSGVFDPGLADRALLFNVDHPDPEDPLHRHGVDDGNGYSDGENRWWFVGTYLVYGQWKQLVVGGIRNLAAAYVITGSSEYAHKAGVLLDRVADIYPTFDFKKEGVMYEGPAHAGYVSTWHDACEETREMALAYDQIFEAIREDGKLVEFLSRKSQEHGLQNHKGTFVEIQRNIEDRILRDALHNSDKIRSNYPRTEIALAVIETVLGWPKNRERVMSLLDETVDKATAVDGVTGEKGLANYSAFVIQALASFLATYSRIDPSFLPDLIDRHPRLGKTYRFHIDTWCLQKYYPQSGDTGWFGKLHPIYQGVIFSRNPGLDPSMYGFLWQLYEATGDPAYVQASYLANDGSSEGLPYDLFERDPDSFQDRVEKVIQEHGANPRVSSINLEEWHLAILRSGSGENARAVWLDYDSGGGHGHCDGMNLGMFAKGLDLMPDFGYPPVQFGGWGKGNAAWYPMTAAHNTVVVDGKDQERVSGRTTLWADGKDFRAIRTSGAELVEASQYERTIAMVDTSDEDFYVLDIFRVAGGCDHTKFTHSFSGEITTNGLTLQPGEEYGHGAVMREFREDPAPAPGWSVDWKIEDRNKFLPPGSDVRFRYTDLTSGARAIVAEAWVNAGGYDTIAEDWIPRIAARRQSEEAPLVSTFISLMEPYQGTPVVREVKRLPLVTATKEPLPDNPVAVEVTLTEGGKDLSIAADTENPLSTAKSTILFQEDWRVLFQGELCLIRSDETGSLQSVAVANASNLAVGQIHIQLREETEFIEIEFISGEAKVVSGNPEDLLGIHVRDLSTP